MTSDDAFELKSVMQQILAQMKDSAAGTAEYSRRTSELIAHEELGRQATAAATKATEKNTASMKSLASTMASFGKNLEKLGSSLNKTQNDFGISLAAAAKLQVAAFTDTIKGFVNLFKSIDFSQLLSEALEVGSAMGDMAANVGKELGNKEGMLKALAEGGKKIAEVLTKERAGKPLEQVATQKERLEATKQFQNEFGGINTEFGNQIATEAKNRGLSVEQLVQARRIFATAAMGDLNKVASIQNRFFDQFKAKGMTPKVALEAITKYAELIARNGNRFADSFARAAADAKKIGVDLNKVSQFGDSVISDFEGFLEKTAELGAMGFNLDGSRLAEISETGSDADLFNELRSQLAATGKDITNLRRSERLALEGMFGMTISEMQRLGGDTPQVTSMEDYAEEGNSLLGKVLALLIAGGPLFSMLSSGLSGVSSALGVGGTVVGKLIELITLLGPAGIIGAAILAIAGVVAIFTADSFEKTKKLKEEAKTTAIGGDYAGAKSKLGEAQMSETMTNMAMMGPEVGMIAPWMASKERDFQQEQINNIYRLQQLSSGNIGPSNPFRGMESGIYTLPQFAPRATSGDRYNQRLADEAVLRGRALTPPIQRAAGGLVTGPGTGKSDSIPTRLSNGEFVINADMVKKLGLSFLNKLNSGAIKDTATKKILSNVPVLSTGISKAQELKAGGTEGLFSLIQNKLGGLFGGSAGGGMSSISKLFTGGGSPMSGMMGLVSKIPGVTGLLGKATGLLGSGGLKGLAGNLLGKVGLGGIGGNLLGGLAGGPMGMLGMAAPLLKKIPFVGSALGAIAGGPNKLIGKLAGSALSKIGGLFGKKKASVANMLPPQMQAMLSGGQPGMEGINLSAMLSQMMGSQQQTQAPVAPVSVDTRGIEQKLNNFIVALQGIQINMDGAQVGKVLVNYSDTAGTTGILRPRTSATF